MEGKQMKCKITFIGTSVILVLLLSPLSIGCTSNEKDTNLTQQAHRDVGIHDETVDWKRFEDPYFGFEFRYPGDWTVELAEAHQFVAKQSDECFVVADARAVKPIADDDRQKTNLNALKRIQDKMGIEGAKPSLVAAGVASALRAVDKMNDGRVAWTESTTYGDIWYRIQVVSTEKSKARCESMAMRIVESFKVTDQVRIAGSPFGQDVVAKSAPPPSLPDGWRVQKNKYGFRFAHPRGWELKEQSGGIGYDYESEGIAFFCMAAANYIQEPDGTQLRLSLRKAFDDMLVNVIPTNSKLSKEPVIRNSGIVRAMVGHGSLGNDKGRFWLSIAVQRDLCYILYLRCTSNCDEVSNMANMLIDSFQVTEELKHSDFMERLIKHPLPWEKS